MCISIRILTICIFSFPTLALEAQPYIFTPSSSTAYFDRIVMAQIQYLSVNVLNGRVMIQDLQLAKLTNPSIKQMSKADLGAMEEIVLPIRNEGEFAGIGRSYSDADKKMKFYLFLQKLALRSTETANDEFINSTMCEILQWILSFSWPIVIQMFGKLVNNSNQANNYQLPIIAPQLNRGDESEDDE